MILPRRASLHLLLRHQDLEPLPHFFVDFSPVASQHKCLQRPLPVHDNVRIPPHDPLLLGPRGGKGNNVVEVADIPAAGICTAQRKKPHNCNAGNGHLDTLTFPSEGSGHL